MHDNQSINHIFPDLTQKIKILTIVLNFRTTPKKQMMKLKRSRSFRSYRFALKKLRLS